ncbi:hypothetical protein [Legionella fallonii]|nr:hypothetical protein [Legionella fallonii]
MDTITAIIGGIITGDATIGAVTMHVITDIIDIIGVTTDSYQYPC